MNDDVSRHPDRAWIDDTRRVVIKIGSSVLVDETHRLATARITTLVGQMIELRRSGREVICVSSGAIAAGRADLGDAWRPTDLPSLQAAAAIGQARLIGLYRECFGAADVPIAQVLLTHADLRDRERHLNARNTLNRLLAAGVVPIINENDTVAVEEIRVGDNDQLSALVACLIRADVLVLLTDADGLMTRPPDAAGPHGTLLGDVERLTEEVMEMAGGAGSAAATGGMRSKLRAADVVTRAGERALIANGRTDGILTKLFAGETLGTVIHPGTQRLRGRKRWIAFFDHPRGDLVIDAGAAGAICSGGCSLLPVGITAVRGRFGRGAPVRIIGPDGREIARGLVNYPSDAVQRIAGHRSTRLAEILDEVPFEEVVHRDNLALRGDG